MESSRTTKTHRGSKSVATGKPCESGVSRIPPKVAFVRCNPADVDPMFGRTVECLGPAVLAAELRNRNLAEVRLFDGEIRDEDSRLLARRVMSWDPDVVGVHLHNPSLPAELTTFARSLRMSGFDGVLAVGGHSPSFYAPTILDKVPEIDVVFLGEADVTFPEMIRRLGSGVPGFFLEGLAGVAYRDGDIIIERPGSLVLDLTSRPRAARDLTEAIVSCGGVAAISTSRGCPFSCSFCSCANYYPVGGAAPGSMTPRWRAREPEDVVEEIRSLSRDHGVRELCVVDEEFFGAGLGYERAERIASLLLREEIKVDWGISTRAGSVREDITKLLHAAGLRHVYLGVESGSEDDLRLFRKGASADINSRAVRAIEETGVSVEVGFIALHPWSTINGVKENYRFLRHLGRHGLYAQTTTWQPYPGTALTTLALELNWVGRSDGELTVYYPDAWQRTLAAVFRRLRDAFIGQQRLVARLSDGITFTWRRKVRGRTAGGNAAVNRLDRALRDVVADVIDTVFRAIESAPNVELDEDTIDAARLRIALDRGISSAHEYLSIITRDVIGELVSDRDPVIVRAMEDMRG